MKSLTNLFLFCAVLSVMACNATKKTAATATETKETVMSTDAPGIISFEAANERYAANGKFDKWHFTNVKMKGNDIESLDANIEIDLTSIWEKSDKLVEHLKAWDYFDVEKFSKATLAISNVRAKSGKQYVADLELAMRDKVQKMETTFELVDKKTMLINGSAMVDRSVFGIGTENTSVPNLIKVTYNTVIPQ